MGIEKTADLFYECQIGMIPQACDYYDLYNVITQAAKTLGMTWEERVNIEEACQAVEIANDPLVHWWKFDETSGTTAHDSVSNKDGALTNMDPLTDWIEGKINGALDFDGINDYVALGAIDALKSGAVTISAWIKTNDVGRTYSPILTQWYYDVQGDHGYYLCLNGNRPTFYLHNVAAISGEIVNVGDWYHLAGTYNSKKLNIYVNGVLKGPNSSQDVDDKTGADRNAYIGSDGVSFDDNHFYGSIDDVRVYTWGVDVDEILDKMFYGTSKFCVKNGSSVRVAWFDDLGNLFLKGTLTTEVEPLNEDPDHDEFRVHDSTGTDVAIIDTTDGNMYIKGGLYDEQEALEPSEESDDFIIKNSNGDVVAYIDESGDVYLKGKLYQQNP
jgi:hypothetical protein